MSRASDKRAAKEMAERMDFVAAVTAEEAELLAAAGRHIWREVRLYLILKLINDLLRGSRKGE
jgi:hypothetical protein